MLSNLYHVKNILGNNANDHIADAFRKCNIKIDTPKKDQKKSLFISSDSVLLLVCYLERLFLQRNARNICVAICGGFAKNIANFTGLLRNSQRLYVFRKRGTKNHINQLD